MKILSKSLFLLLTLVLANSYLKQAKASYDYPHKDPLTATISYAIIQGDPEIEKIKQNFKIEMLIGRNNIYLLEGRGLLSYNVYPQEAKAPLMVILAGLGGNGGSGYLTMLADEFYKNGFHVITISSPFNWNFSLSSSESAFPGVTEDDAKDIYVAMQKVLLDVKSNLNLEYKQKALISVSLGALEAAYISALDENENKIGFTRYLLINPVVDLKYAAEKLDSMVALAAKVNVEKVNDLAFDYGWHQLFERSLDDPNYYLDVEKGLPLNNDEKMFLVGSTLRAPLGDVIFVSQQINDLGILKNKATFFSRNARFDEISPYGFIDYLKLFLLPVYNKYNQTYYTVDDLKEHTNFQSIPGICSNKKVFLMHNSNDFIVTEKNINWLKSCFQKRATIYPIGGHLGNLWYPENKTVILKTFESLLN